MGISFGRFELVDVQRLFLGRALAWPRFGKPEDPGRQTNR
jgi:hypothetical protein